MATADMTLKLSAEGVHVVAEIIAQLKTERDSLLASLTAVQAVSTRQVDEISTLRNHMRLLSHGLLCPRCFRQEDELHG